MILEKTSVLGALIIAVRKGKRVSHVRSFDTEKKTVRDVMGQTHPVDYFVAYKAPDYVKLKLLSLGIESTRDVNAYIKRKNRELTRAKRQRRRKTKGNGGERSAA